MTQDEEIYEYSEKAARERSIRISTEICELVNDIDVSNKSQMKRLKSLLKQQTETLSPLEREIIDTAELKKVVNSLESDSIEEVYAGLMASLKVLGKFFMTIK